MSPGGGIRCRALPAAPATCTEGRGRVICPAQIHFWNVSTDAGTAGSVFTSNSFLIRFCVAHARRRGVCRCVSAIASRQ